MIKKNMQVYDITVHLHVVDRDMIGLLRRLIPEVDLEFREEVLEGVDGESHHIIETPLDPIDEEASCFLDAVPACFIHPVFLFEVGIDRLLGEGIERDVGGFNGAEEGIVFADGDGGEDIVRFSRESFKHFSSRFEGVGFVEDGPFKKDDGISSDNEMIGIGCDKRFPFFLSKGFYVVFGIAGERNGAFIKGGGGHGEGE